MNELTARNRIQRRFADLQPSLYRQTYLAYLGNANGLVIVPDRPGYVYATVASSPPIEIYNKRVQPAVGLPVEIGYDPTEPNLLQVLGTVTQTSDGGTLTNQQQVGPHAASHQISGTDPLYIQKRQIMPGRIGPAVYYSGSAVSGSAAVEIQPDIVYVGGEWRSIPYQVLDLTSSIPGSGSSVLVLVSISGSGTVTTTAGSVIAGYMPAVTDIPDIPYGHLAAGVVRLWNGMQATNDDNVYTDFLDTRTMLVPHLTDNVVTGTGTPKRIMQWSATPPIAEDSTLVKSGSGVLTITTGASNLGVTIPASGSAAMGAGTLSVSSVNDPTIADHTHAITTDATGASNAHIPATDSSGFLIVRRLGLGGITPAVIVDIAGTAAQTVRVIRNPTVGANGANFTLQSGGGASAGTDRSAGSLILSSGASTGFQQGTVRIDTASNLSASGSVTAVTVYAAGTGYTVGDVLTLTGGGNNATLTVATLGSGSGVATVTISAAGSGYGISNNVATTGGTGTNAAFNITTISGTADNNPAAVLTITGKRIAILGSVNALYPVYIPYTIDQDDARDNMAQMFNNFNYQPSKPTNFSLFAIRNNITVQPTAGGVNHQSGQLYGSENRAIIMGDVNYTGAVQGFYNSTDVYTSGSTTQVAGAISTVVKRAGSGILSTAYSQALQFTQASGSYVNNLSMLRIQTPSITGAAGINNLYGAYIEAMTAGGVLSYAIFTNAGLIRLGDQVNIVGSADRVQLLVKNFSTQSTNAVEVQPSSSTTPVFFVSGSGVTETSGRRKTVATISAATYTALTTDEVIIVTATCTVTLPAATGSGQTYRIANEGTDSVVVTIDGNGTDTIKRSLTQTLYSGEDLIITDYAAGKWA